MEAASSRAALSGCDGWRLDRDGLLRCDGLLEWGLQAWGHMQPSGRHLAGANAAAIHLSALAAIERVATTAIANAAAGPPTTRSVASDPRSCLQTRAGRRGRP